MNEPRYPYVWVHVKELEADEASAALFDLGALGIEERDASTLIKGAPGRVTLVASFETQEDAELAIGQLPLAWDPALHEVIGDSFRDEWKKHFHPFAVCEGVVVRPPWEPYDPKPGERVLELEPGRAFGTGLHETTSLVSHELATLEAELRGRERLDLGCGSGILSLVGLVKGAARARATDIDPEAVEVTRENAVRNGLENRIDADCARFLAVEQKYPVVVANIEARVLIPHAREIMNTVAPSGVLILSGLLAPQRDDVLAAYTPFTLEAEPVRGEWIALRLRAPKTHA